MGLDIFYALVPWNGSAYDVDWYNRWRVFILISASIAPFLVRDFSTHGSSEVFVCIPLRRLALLDLFIRVEFALSSNQMIVFHLFWLWWKA